LQDFNKDVGREVIQYKRCDSTHLGGWMPDAFERVLCDVPCYTDRHIVKESI
jgi:16S rRNA C967 or C1407 C5-methylase (RsmB/RsmF family)